MPVARSPTETIGFLSLDDLALARCHPGDRSAVSDPLPPRMWASEFGRPMRPFLIKPTPPALGLAANDECCAVVNATGTFGPYVEGTVFLGARGFHGLNVA